jgi:hypothetical protein
MRLFPFYVDYVAVNRLKAATRAALGSRGAALRKSVRTKRVAEGDCDGLVGGQNSFCTHNTRLALFEKRWFLSMATRFFTSSPLNKNIMQQQ